MLRSLRPPEYGQQQYQQHLMRGMPNGAMNMGMKQGNPLQRAAMANSQKYAISYPSSSPAQRPPVLGTNT